jgi:hypothetical protein
MTARKRAIAISVAFAACVALACGGGGTVARFAPCSVATDTCPSATVCETVTTTGNGEKQVSEGQPFCTWTCTDDDFDEQQCPTDATGVMGICVVALGDEPIGDEYNYGFCFQDCSSSAACPDGETCAPAQTFRGGTSAMVCVPTPTDALSATTWVSATIPPTAASSGVVTSTYAITFEATSAAVDGYASGAFDATLTLVYGSAAFELAGCTETTTFSSGIWVDVPPMQTSAGVLGLSNTSALTVRTGCNTPEEDTSTAENLYEIDTSDNGAVYNLSGSTMTIAGGAGVVPFDDDVAWTFTKQ